MQLVLVFRLFLRAIKNNQFIHEGPYYIVVFYDIRHLWLIYRLVDFNYRYYHLIFKLVYVSSMVVSTEFRALQVKPGYTALLVEPP